MEPGTPTPTIKHGAREYPLAWTKRSEAVLSRLGHDVSSLLDLLRNRKTGLYALCLGIKVALPPANSPDAPEDIAEWLPDDAAQIAASNALITIIKHAYPVADEKKSELKS